MPAQAARSETPPRWSQWLMTAIALVLACIVLRGLLLSRGFPLVHDAAIMRYVVFMIDRGHAPYTQQIEMNLPGTLMTEWFSLHVFGDDAAGLWRYDTFIGLIAIAAAAWIAGAGYRAAGIGGAMLAWLLHQADGARDFAQRDWFLAALLLLAAACATQAVRRAAPAWVAAALCLASWGAAIKPYVVLFALALLGIALLKARGREQKLRILVWSLAGVAVPMLAVILYFAHWPGSFGAFLETERTVGAWYAALDKAPLVSMITQVLLYPVFMVFVIALYLWLRERAWHYSTDLFLFTGFLCSLLLYLLQRKGFMYQTYSMDMFGFVGGFVVAQRALHQARDQRLPAVLLLMAGAWRLPLHYYRAQGAGTYPAATQQALVADLQRLGGSRLSGHVQCLDMTLGGCIGALDALHLEQSTGFVNDHILFPYEERPFLAKLQQRFLSEILTEPPQLIVLSDHNWPNEQDHTFSKLTRWPQFADFLQQHYRLESTYVATTKARTADYRLYVLNDAFGRARLQSCRNRLSK